KFIGNTHFFPHKEARVAYLVNLLSGHTRKWIRPYINNAMDGGSVPWKDIKEFFGLMRWYFGDLDPKTTADRAIKKLQQGNREYASYHTEFVEHTIELN